MALEFYFESFSGSYLKMVLIKIPLRSLLNEFFIQMELPTITETLSHDPDNNLFCCCLSLPALNSGEVEFQSVDICGYSGNNIEEAKHYAAHRSLEYIQPIYNTEIHDYSSELILELTEKKGKLELAHNSGMESLIILNQKYNALRELYDQTISIFRSISNSFRSINLADFGNF